ncbi:Transmembrane protease serine 11C [Holothuria leucospilota]|uniref:Transmembrane protease serine 11C n=1 Tax=Holothuria leucospilota TaxID=206669 RepID=A0A9Q1HE38_HOLLE|nr:Transmembrane protease serine 11C [Holothuria leucospilota]
MKVSLVLVTLAVAASVLFTEAGKPNEKNKRNFEKELLKTFQSVLTAKKNVDNEAQVTSRAKSFYPGFHSTYLVKERKSAKAKDPSMRSKLKKRLHTLIEATRRDFNAQREQEAERAAKRDELMQDKKVYLKEKEAHKELVVDLISSSVTEVNVSQATGSVTHTRTVETAVTKSDFRLIQSEMSYLLSDDSSGSGCSGDEFQCGNGECIPWYWECDNFKDCDDGLDEMGCTCPSGSFTCADGSCIYGSWQCDDWDDCGDNSDEVGCDSDGSSSYVEPSSSVFSSSGSYYQSSSSSLPASSSFDESSSAEGSSGESSAPSSAPVCDGFQCQNGACIHASWECDNWDDCGDASDEVQCNENCPQGTVRCANGWKCISTSWICDDFDDCGDNWDEQNCGGEGVIRLLEGQAAESEQEQPHLLPMPPVAGLNGVTGPDVTLGVMQVSGNEPEPASARMEDVTEKVQSGKNALMMDVSLKQSSRHRLSRFAMNVANTCDSGCGTRVIEGAMHRIVGGETAARGAWPWQAQLFLSESYFTCGGTLVGPRHVISAAHCFQGNVYGDANNWKVHFGKQDLTLSVGEGETASAVEKLIIHENYNSQTSDNDIAMMILAEDQSPSDTINFACLDLDSSKRFDSSSDCFITGWGATSWQGNVASQLQEANVPLVDSDTCNQSGSYGGAITDNMLCAGFAAGGVDACQGDSGGPLVCSSKDNDSDVERWYLVGVTSWGYGCAFPNYPGVYADVSKYMSWIQNHINSN